MIIYYWSDSKQKKKAMWKLNQEAQPLLVYMHFIMSSVINLFSETYSNYDFVILLY